MICPPVGSTMCPPPPMQAWESGALEAPSNFSTSSQITKFCTQWQPDIKPIKQQKILGLKWDIELPWEYLISSYISASLGCA